METAFRLEPIWKACHVCGLEHRYEALIECAVCGEDVCRKCMDFRLHPWQALCLHCLRDLEEGP